MARMTIEAGWGIDGIDQLALGAVPTRPRPESLLAAAERRGHISLTSPVLARVSLASQ